jgi:LysM repeat protein
MSRKQAVLIIAVNAIISTLISVVVVLLVVNLNPLQIDLLPTPTALAPASETQPVVTEASPAPSDLVTHVVAAGDTISGLALQYDVPGEDIIAANQLENPNFLQVGMQLIIPIGGIPEVTATFTPAPTPTNTEMPFEPPSADMTATAAALLAPTEEPLPTQPPPENPSLIAISEVLDAGDVTQERVVILNNGDQVADMQGWTLADTKGNVYTFPNFRLWGGGSVLVHTRAGQDGSPPNNFYWGKLEALWTLGEVVSLQNAEGQVLSTFAVAP